MMKKPLDNQLIIESVQVLGHSLWIGTLLALIYFFFSKSSPDTPPSARVSRGLTILFAVPPLSIFFGLCETLLIRFPGVFSVVLPVSLIRWIWFFWLSGTIISVIYLLARFLQLHQARGKSVPLIQPDKSLVDQIRNDLNVPPQLSIRSSTEASTPMLCGLIQPVVILPQSILQKSTTPCLESMIAHEMAHFRRKDLWFNLGQSIIDALFFFHPAMRWLSREIRMEREKACDDQAVSTLDGRRFLYAAALLEAEGSVSHGNLALAFGRESTSDRAARIAFGDPTVRKPFSGVLAGLCLVIAILTSWALFSVVKVGNSPPDLAESPKMRILVDPPDRGIPPIPDIAKTNAEWNDKKVGGRDIPMLKSVHLIERDGIVYDLTKTEPRLFPELHNPWLLEYNLDYLSRNLPSSDPDGDLFTVSEEFAAGTDPKDPSSHPGRVLLLRYMDRHFELYRVKYAARTDAETVQLSRLPTKKHPTPGSWFLKSGETTPDGRIRIEEIASDSVVLRDLESGLEQRITKQSTADFKTYFAEFSIRGGENFFVKEGSTFSLPGEQESKWKLRSVGEAACSLHQAELSGEPPIVLTREP